MNRKKSAPSLTAVMIEADKMEVAYEQVRDFVSLHGNRARFGTLDLRQLAAECYLQGVMDGVQVAAMQPEVMKVVKPA